MGPWGQFLHPQQMVEEFRSNRHDTSKFISGLAANQGQPHFFFEQ